MKELLTSRYDANEAAMSVDFLNAEAQEIANLETLIDELTGSTNDVIISGGTVQERSSPSMNVDIASILSFCQNTGKIAQKPTLYGPIAIDDGGATDRYDTVEMRQLVESYDQLARKYRDPITGVVSTP